MGIKSMVLETDCLGLNPAFLTCYCGLWISKVTFVYSTCLFFFFFCTITTWQVPFEVPEVQPGPKETKASVCIEFR